MDTYTRQALTTGRVTLPGGTTPARTWFRLLRTIIDEITDLPADADNVRAVLRQTGASEHQAGNEDNDWRPYEGLDCNAQDQTLQAAATAIAAPKTAPSPATATPHFCSKRAVPPAAPTAIPSAHDF